MENIEACKVGGQDYCGDQDEDENMFAKASFSSFDKTDKNWSEEEGKTSYEYPPNSDVVI